MSSHLIVLVLSALWVGSFVPLAGTGERPRAVGTVLEEPTMVEEPDGEAQPDLDELGGAVREEYKSLYLSMEGGMRQRAAAASDRILTRIWRRVQDGIAAILRSAPEVD